MNHSLAGLPDYASDKAEMRSKAVLVSSPTMRGVLEVQALRSAGYSVTFDTALCFSQLNWLPNRSSFSSLRKYLSIRLHPELAGLELHRIWHPELLSKGLQAMGLSSLTTRHKVHNYLFDKSVSRHVTSDFDVFHFVNGVGLFSASRARVLGLRTVMSQRAAHPEHDAEILDEEFKRYRIYDDYDYRSFAAHQSKEYELADAIIVQSTYSAQTFVDRGLGNKIHVINFSYNERRFSGHTRSTDGTFRILFVGSITPRKGVQYLVDAFDKAALGDAELWLIGSLHPSLAGLISGRRNVYHRAHVPQTELAKLYSTGSVLVLPALSDAWGFVVLEAMALGLPVIVTENTGAKDAVRSGVDGFIVPIRDADALAKDLTHLYENRHLCEQMGRNASQRAQEFGSRQYLQRFAREYEKILR